MAGPDCSEKGLGVSLASLGKRKLAVTDQPSGCPGMVFWEGVCCWWWLLCPRPSHELWSIPVSMSPSCTSRRQKIRSVTELYKVTCRNPQNPGLEMLRVEW